MKNYFQNIRKANKNIPVWGKISVSIGLIIAGFLLGIFQKWLDGSGFNELPGLFQTLDLTNFFGRIAIWILLATIISVYSSSPIRASINTFLFLISMIAGYYIYCNFVLGFLPRSYMLVWIVVSFVSIIPAFICWYAKGKGIIAIIISAVILGVLFAQAFLFTQGFMVTHVTEVITWAIALIILLRKPKEFAIEVGLSLVVALLYQLFIPYWG